MEFKEFFEEIKKQAEKFEIQITQKQAILFFEYMKDLKEANKKVNLTAITEEKQVILKHFIDSILITNYIRDDEQVIDIGSGAGFPGIPVKIIKENIQIKMIDSIKKKVNFIQEEIKKLGFEKAQAKHIRAEELAKEEGERENYQIATTRAVSKISTIVEYMLPFVEIGGLCICMKGPNYEEELEEGKKAIQLLGGKIEKIDTYELPEVESQRNLILIRKIKQTPKQFPRKPGKPIKEPIK